MERVLEPEWLDELPPQDAPAQQSRADLRRLNRLMGHVRFFVQALQALPVPRRVCDLGAGDGTLLLGIVRALGWRGVELVLVDRQPVVAGATRASLQESNCAVTIVEADVGTALDELAAVDLILANLFLHHFTDDRLRKMLRRIATLSRCFVACEPRRSTWSLLASRCLGVIGCNPVTRHDGIISVRAGFRGSELTHLWPESAGWLLRERAAGLFSHSFVAQR